MTATTFIYMYNSHLSTKIYPFFEHDVQKFDICLLVLYVKGAKDCGIEERNVGTHRNAKESSSVFGCRCRYLFHGHRCRVFGGYRC